MKVKMILPALTAATSPYWRPIKYSLSPLGLATLAGYLGDNDEVTLQDEHVEALDLSDQPELVVIQVYISSAYRAYALADHYRSKGAYITLGGLHVTSLPEEASHHADTIFLGPGEDTWPAFLADFRAGDRRQACCSPDSLCKSAGSSARQSKLALLAGGAVCVRAGLFPAVAPRWSE
jgi:radical SAM superfamily enzyme YgiQ (UPF0313 family)